MSLTRRSSQSELHLADPLLQPALRWSDLVAKLAVEERRDVVLLDDLADVGRVCLGGCVFIFDRQPGTEFDAGLDSGEEKAGAQRAAAGESVEETRQVLDYWRKEVDVPGIQLDLEVQLQRRHFDVTRKSNGMVTGEFALPRLEGETLLTAVDAIRPGDYVDVLVTTLELPESMTPEQREEARTQRPWDFLRTRVVFQNLRVHNVGPFVGPDAKEQPKTGDTYLTFIVDRDTALQLKWLKDIVALGQANVDFVLRSPGNSDQLPAEPMTVQE